ncbi:MAG: hypothetical protein JOZ87_21030 [Chloroflexi bacterium]|nr:hypothetical protein [Chloroflexota bacterium]
MDESQLRLDGNAAAGVLRQLFADELTTARGACAACGGIAPIGSQHLYMQTLSPGGVLRCRTCEEVLIVLVHSEGKYRLGMRGLKWIEIVDTSEAGAH